jgi:hypothetical protein
VKGGLFCFVLALGLPAETSLASAQTANPPLVAQGSSSAPLSGILTTPPPAPVFVPPSGVLPNVQRHGRAVRPTRTDEQIQVAKKSAPISTHRHNVGLRTASRHHTVKRPMRGAQSKAPTLALANSAAEEQHHGEEGFESFLPQFGKAKEAR